MSKLSLPLILLIVAVVAVFFVIGVYNGLVSLKNRIKASIQEIGNQLKRQADLIPNLETSAKAYLKHEKDILKMLADARKLVDAGQDASDKVSQLLPKLQVIVESNPQMKGADVITQLMDELRDTSDKVMYSRRTLIDITADYNIKLASFPTNLVANAFGFQSEKGLETPMSGAHLTVSESDIKTPKVSL
ncbi:LemA family protein [Candidatus Amesbacteria bacterium]|nr:LemA family protein [Candidatus Amesbacteria bacterium]